MAHTTESWHLSDQDGHVHTVEAGRAGLRWQIRWECDGVEVESKKTFDTTPVLNGKDRGALRLRLPAYPGPVQEVALHTVSGPDQALVRAAFAERGDGEQFSPEPGSRAEAQLEWMNEHPLQYLAGKVGLAAAGLAVPLIFAALAALFVWKLEVPMPELPTWDVPLPDLPDLPDLPVPGWVSYVVPVLLAGPYAWLELRKARKQRDKQVAR
ncbi:hypothetical protein LWF15_09275 [Kineosporia rhizophila]|uniref:hypothetical protein n=1 Tax=Kineosporia rhizophila TaxID=84633 RepID=UPI001E4748B3|nr:hypothetical protein [Kineosporia rhizophila]MCE0535703.1 hypothetical protein [Kineosporia rhizophila]